MPTKKELNPSPAEVSGEGKDETISATLGKDYGTLSPNPNFDDKNVEGEHATPVRVEKAAEVQPTEVHNSAQVLKLIKEYDEAHPVSGGTKLYVHSFNISSCVLNVVSTKATKYASWEEVRSGYGLKETVSMYIGSGGPVANKNVADIAVTSSKATIYYINNTTISSSNTANVDFPNAANYSVTEL